MGFSGPLIVLVATLLISVVSSDHLLAPLLQYRTSIMPAESERDSLLQSRTSIMPAESESNSLVMMADAPRDPANENSALDWCECMICQKSTREVLRCPCNGPSNKNPGVIYEEFAVWFQQMRQLGSEPVKQHFKLHNLFDNTTLPEIAAEMLSKQGIWHKSCYNLFSGRQVTRGLSLRKRTQPDSAALTDPVPTEPMGPTDAGGSLNDQGPRKSLRAASLDHDHEKCIFCQEHSSDSPLRKIATYECGTRFYEIANVLQFQPLLTILTFADHGKKGVEYDMKYHDICRTSMFNLYKSYQRNTSSMDSISDQHAILAARAFCYLTHHVEKMVEEGQYYITFPHLVLVHNEYRETLGIPSKESRGGAPDQALKEKLGLHFNGEADWVKRDDKTYSLCFQSGLRKNAFTHDHDNAFKILGDAAKIIREAMFNHETTSQPMNLKISSFNLAHKRKASRRFC